jgi:twitching motility two-component system response regulator PilH
LARKVLLADDSVTAQNMGRRIMTDAGYEVITVNNGSAALKKIHESQPDLIVLDVYMPGYGGLEVCQRLKESEATMKIPVLLTVGKMEPFKVDEAKRVHADGHIIKPFDASELLSALTKLEDKIVPSENGRGRRGKTETRKSRTAPAADPAVNFDDSHTEQIQYLARVRQRHPIDEVPEATDSAFAEAAADATPASDEAAAAKTQAAFETNSYAPAPPPAEEEANQEQRDESVTFAAGPIYELELTAPAAIEKPAEEFEIQREPEIEQEPQIEYELEPAREISSTPFVAEPLPELERPPISEISATEPIAALEPGLVTEGERDYSTPQAEPAPRWVAENIAHSSEEAERSLEEEMQQAQATNGTGSDETSSQEPARQAEPQLETEGQRQPEPEGDQKEGAAFAAAASASESFAQTSAVSPSSPEAEAPSGSESSAAWDNWQRIRDTVITERATEAIAESASVIADAAISSQNGAPPVPSASEAEPTSQPASNHDALSSIVDSVLAELKPRLLAEIAKQLAQDKK